MSTDPRDEAAALPALLARVQALAAARLAALPAVPAAQAPVALPPAELPAKGAGTAAVLERFTRTVAPHLSASTGPRYLGFVTGGVTPAALVGDWLASLYDQNPISELDSAAALQVERDTVAMLRALFRLPAEFEGTFVTGATLSNFLGLAVAREWAGRERGTRVSAAGLWQQAPVPVLAATPHASAGKALSMLGMGRSAWQPVACLPEREAMDVAALESALNAVEGPAIVVASAGTVNTGDFDDFRALAALKARRPFWLHVDAAFGGFARLSPGLESLVEGWEAADSLCLDLHKWLNVPYDAAVAFTRHRPLQVEVFASASAYLGAPGDQPEPIHLAPENSHRWRALPAWFSLLAYGAEGHRQIVERDCALARELGERLAGHPAFELLAPVRLNVVCFALKDAGADDHAAYVRRVRDGGATFISPTVLRQRPALRAAFSHWQTGGEDLERVWGGLVSAIAMAS